MSLSVQNRGAGPAIAGRPQMKKVKVEMLSFNVHLDPQTPYVYTAVEIGPCAV